MSRFAQTHPTKPNLVVAYGLDHVLGYFVQVFDTDKDDDEQLILDKDGVFDKISKGDLIEKLKEFNVKEDHINAVALDIDFN